jgi:hypothetical protein
MAIFAVFGPPQQDRETTAHALRFVIVRDGFSWRAFAFGPLWMLRHRMWLVLMLYVIFVGALMTAMYFLQLSQTVQFVAVVLFAVLIGLESATLRRWTFQRRGWRDLGIVAAADANDAERRFFDRWVEGNVAPPPSSTSQPTPTLPYGIPARDMSSDVIGLFPQPGGQR